MLNERGARPTITHVGRVMNSHDLMNPWESCLPYTEEYLCRRKAARGFPYSAMDRRKLDQNARMDERVYDVTLANSRMVVWGISGSPAIEPAFFTGGYFHAACPSTPRCVHSVMAHAGLAWSRHMQIAYLAYKQLDPVVKERADALLSHHVGKRRSPASS